MIFSTSIKLPKKSPEVDVGPGTYGLAEYWRYAVQVNPKPL